MALEAGVDLVIELPTIFSSASAEFFAQGAISILDSLQIVDSICFGAETSNLDKLNNLAEILSNESKCISNKIKNALNEGISYPKARAAAFVEHEDIMSSPNNILGIEYLKALKKIKSKITPYIIERKIQHLTDAFDGYGQGGQHADAGCLQLFLYLHVLCFFRKAGNKIRKLAAAFAGKHHGVHERRI
jgi:predicted nucleotidyltransferase